MTPASYTVYIEQTAHGYFTGRIKELANLVKVEGAVLTDVHRELCQQLASLIHEQPDLDLRAIKVHTQIRISLLAACRG